MKTKCILSLILLAAMVLSLAACSATNTDTHTAAEPTQPSTTAGPTQPSTTAEPTQPSTTAGPTQPSTTALEGTVKVPPLEVYYLLDLSEKAIIESCKNMLQLSQEEELSLIDMQNIGDNFFFLWQVADIRCLTESMSAIENMATETFSNVLAQSIAHDINLEDLSIWGSIPVGEIQSKFFSSHSFGSGATWDFFFPFELVKEEEIALTIAKIIRNNHTFQSNFHIAEYFIQQSQFPEVRELGLSRMLELSMVPRSPESSYYTRCFCLSVERCREYLEDDSILYNIRENILKNNFLDFVEKYDVFCNSTEISTASQALEHLMLQAENPPSPEVEAMIMEVAGRLWDGDAAALLLKTLDSN